VATHTGAAGSPRILCVADERPWPERTGYRIRLANVVRGLADAGEVDLLVLHGEPDAVADATVPDGEPVRRIVTAPLPVPVRTGRGLLLWLRSGRPRRIVWRDWTAARAAFDRTIADGYDLVWWSHLDTWVELGARTDRPAVVDLDNLEDRWLAGRRAVSRQGSRRGRIRDAVATRLDSIDAARWRRLQARAADATAAAIVCTEADRVAVARPKVRIVPNGYARPPAPVGHPERPVPASGGVVAFVGLQTYEPNVDASRFLVEQVLPHLRAARPDAEVHLIGRAGPEVEALAEPGVRVLGEVADLDAALAGADLVAVPVRFGGGTRIKVLEAMAQRIPIVTTSAGCEGLGVRDGVEAEVADDPAAFAAACDRLLADPERRVALAGAAAALHAARFEWRTIREGIAVIARDAMAA
jgi:glycosyltransferase involved in cell wall biosynthesis